LAYDSSNGQSEAAQAPLELAKLSPARIGGYTCFVVGFVMEALSRPRAAGDAQAMCAHDVH